MKNHLLQKAAIVTLIGLLGLQSSIASTETKKVSWDDILNDKDSPENVLMYGMGPEAKRYSKLDEINIKTVKDLVPAWTYSFGGEKQRGQESQALVYDGIIYVTGSYSRLFALDAKSGKKVWSYEHRLPSDIKPCCDVINRGAAIFGDKVFFGTLDAGIVALNKDTGKVIWKKRFGYDDRPNKGYEDGYTMTGAPTIVKDKKTGKVMLIHGSSGDEFGVIGKLFALDPDTGKEIWMRPMVEGHYGRLNGKKSTPTGDPKAPTWPDDKNNPTGKKTAWSHGGGAPWQSASYDYETNSIIIGTGNPAPWNTWERTADGGDPRDWDSLYTSGQISIDPTTGDIKWFYQHTPNDGWDFSGNNELVLFDYVENGKTIKATGHADRNGFFYVINREAMPKAEKQREDQARRFIKAFPFVDKITWASHIDEKTGRPVVDPNQYPPLPKEGESQGKAINVAPPFLGGKNWNPMAYNEETKLFYLGANHWEEDYWTTPIQYNKGAAYLGQGFRIKKTYDDHVGILRAVDPVKGEIVWSHKEKLPLWSGVLTTKGGLVFTGTSDGYFKAFNAKTGEELFKFQTGSGIISCPITWEEDGEQYIGLASGYGGAVPLWGGEMAELTKPVSQGGSFWVFKLKK